MEEIKVSEVEVTDAPTPYIGVGLACGAICVGGLCGALCAS
ncbi:MAG: hypothetical protein RR678_11390 [Lachnospiraceae bacterium]